MVAQLNLNPASRIQSQRQLVTSLRPLGIGSARFIHDHNGLVIDGPGLGEPPVEAQQVGLAPEGLSEAEAVHGGCRWVLLKVGQKLLVLECLAVKDRCLAGVAATADQQIRQQGAGPGESLPGVPRHDDSRL